jgi:hypothetical protein
MEFLLIRSMTSKGPRYDLASLRVGRVILIFLERRKTLSPGFISGGGIFCSSAET